MMGCKKYPCSYPRMTYIKFRVYFTPLKEEINDLDISFSTKFLWTMIPIPGMQRDGCKYANELCPLKVNQVNNFNATIYIPFVTLRVSFY